jgi:hypothetical protein
VRFVQLRIAVFRIYRETLSRFSCAASPWTSTPSASDTVNLAEDAVTTAAEHRRTPAWPYFTAPVSELLLLDRRQQRRRVVDFQRLGAGELRSAAPSSQDYPARTWN